LFHSPDGTNACSESRSEFEETGSVKAAKIVILGGTSYSLV